MISEIGPVLSKDEQRAMVMRVCSSRHFAKSPRLREFLLHITERSLENRAAEINEIEIAREVFERGVNFTPQDDSVVRSAARQLRLKLKEYFDDEGRTEPWRVDVPKGSYVPVFVPQQTGSDPPPVAAPVQQSSKRLLWLLAGGNAILLALCSGLFWYFGLRRSALPADPPSLVSTFLEGADGTVPVVVSDFSLAAMRHLKQSDPSEFTLDEYARSDYTQLRSGPNDSRDTSRIFDLLRTHRITRSGDLSIVVGILRASGLNRRVVIRHARDVSARELRPASHIILGNPYSTPWVEPYEERLGYRWLRGRGYRDVRAADGQLAEYVSKGSSFDEWGSGFGRLACLPNLSGQGSVLLISGINMVTMEATGEAALSPESWVELRKRLGITASSRLPAFEAILRTEALDNAPQHAQVVAARRLP